MIVDSSALVAYFVAADRDHAAVDALIATNQEVLIVSPYVVAEVDYLVSNRAGPPDALAALRELAGGAWHLTDFGVEELRAAIDLMERYSDQDIGVTDASLVVLAKRYGTRTIATLDRRHFEVLRPIQGGHFTIVP